MEDKIKFRIDIKDECGNLSIMSNQVSDKETFLSRDTVSDPFYLQITTKGEDIPDAMISFNLDDAKEIVEGLTKAINFLEGR